MSTPIKLNQSSFFSRKVLTVPAGLTVPVSITGNNFVCTSATGQFFVKFDGGEEFPMDTGMGFKLLPEDFFGILEIRNPSASDSIDIAFYAGRGDITKIVVEAKLAPTRLLAGGPSHVEIIGAGVSLTVPGTNAGQRRKQIIVTNMDLSSDLTVLVGTVRAARIFPRTAWTFETDATVVLKNETGSTMVVNILETYYTT